MSLSPELKHQFQTSLNTLQETREVVSPVFANNILADVLNQRFPDNPHDQELWMAKFSPIAEWLAQPKTIEEYERLKYETLFLGWNNSESKLEWQINEKLRTYDETTKQWQPNEEYQQWKQTVDIFLDLAARLRIFDENRVNQLRLNKEAGDWDVIHFIEDGPLAAEYTHTHDSIQSLARTLNIGRNWYVDPNKISRVGLIIGDFRVGDHSAHGDLIKKAKEAVGIHGWLVVVTPTNETILHTTNKKIAWSDEERIYRLGSNKYIDHLLLADMPPEYYTHPDDYWTMLWKQLQPDLIFLGEENHPLEHKYRMQSMYLGGILLINKAPITVRSEDLLHPQAITHQPKKAVIDDF